MNYAAALLGELEPKALAAIYDKIRYNICGRYPYFLRNRYFRLCLDRFGTDHLGTTRGMHDNHDICNAL